MADMLILGLGYTGMALAKRLRASGWTVASVRREADSESLSFVDRLAVQHEIATSTHILSSVPPVEDADPVLAIYGDAIARSAARWIGYLSSTGVYGDTGGAWVDESAPIGGGRRSARAAADAQWAARRDDMRVFRLPGIYGPGRSALDRIRDGKARRIDQPGQVFSRIHVDDIVAALMASFDAPPGVYNIADDLPCPQNRVIEAACDLLGAPWPPLQSLRDAQMSPQARAFHSENRRVANAKAKRLLGWTPLYPTYREGLAACYAAERDRMATIMPASASTAPAPASSDQR